MKNRGPLLVVKTKLQSPLIWLVFMAMALPTIILGGGSLLLLRDSADSGMAGVQVEVRVVVLVSMIVLFPVSAALLFGWAFYLTNRIVGPVERMIREIDARILGTGSGPIVLRPKDLLVPLAERINGLIEELEKRKRSQS